MTHINDTTTLAFEWGLFTERARATLDPAYNTVFDVFRNAPAGKEDAQRAIIAGVLNVIHGLSGEIHDEMEPALRDLMCRAAEKAGNGVNAALYPSEAATDESAADGAVWGDAEGGE